MPSKTSFAIPYLTILNSKQVFQNARKKCIATSVLFIFQPIFILQSEIQKSFFFSLYSLRKQNHLTKLCHFRHVRFTISFHDIVLQFLHSLVFMLELNTTHKRHSPAGHHMSFHYNYPYNPYIDCGPLSSSNYFTVQV